MMLIDKVYLKSALSYIKILEIIALIMCFAMVLSFDLQVVILTNEYNTLRFYILVTCVAWITCLIIFFLNITRLTKKLNIPWHWVNVIFGVVFSLFMLLAATLLSRTLTDMEKRTDSYGSKSNIYTQCAYIDKTQSRTTCTVLEVSIVIGFVIAVVFIAEVIICGLKLRHGETSHNATLPQHNFIDDLTVSTVVAI